MKAQRTATVVAVVATAASGWFLGATHAFVPVPTRLRHLPTSASTGPPASHLQTDNWHGLARTAPLRDARNSNDIASKFADLASQEPASIEQRVRDVFNLVDADNSGNLCLDELAALLEKLDLDATGEEVQALFLELDHDGSGFVDYDEFLAWYEDAADAASDRREEFLRVVMGRRCSPAFEMTPVPMRVVDDAITAATFAPDHRKSDPWLFRVLGPDTLDAMAGSMGLRKPAAPACVVVTCALDHSSVEEEADDYASCCCAVQNMMLALHVEGLGTRWVSPGSHELSSSEARVQFDETLGIDPTQERLVAVVWIGFARGGLERIPMPRRLGVSDVRVALP